MSSKTIASCAQVLIDDLEALEAFIVTAESCTGGLIAGAITEQAGASLVLGRGFVTYSNSAKVELLGVPAALIEAHGAVSEPVARAMAEGALRADSAARFSVAVTGVAGPGGGTTEKPVGLVHLAASERNGKTLQARKLYRPERASGSDQAGAPATFSRREIREASVRDALKLVQQLTAASRS